MANQELQELQELHECSVSEAVATRAMRLQTEYHRNVLQSTNQIPEQGFHVSEACLQTHMTVLISTGFECRVKNSHFRSAASISLKCVSIKLPSNTSAHTQDACSDSYDGHYQHKTREQREVQPFSLQKLRSLWNACQPNPPSTQTRLQAQMMGFVSTGLESSVMISHFPFSSFDLFEMLVSETPSTLPCTQGASLDSYDGLY